MSAKLEMVKMKEIWGSIDKDVFSRGALVKIVGAVAMEGGKLMDGALDMSGTLEETVGV